VVSFTRGSDVTGRKTAFPSAQLLNFASDLKSLHILQVTNRIPWPLNDGGNIATYNLTRYLYRAGHQVEIASLNTVKHYQDPKVIEEATAVHAVDIDTTITAWGAFKGLFSRTPYNVARFWSPGFASMLGELVRNGEFDLVQLEGTYTSLYVDVIRKATKAPIILRSHNVEHLIWQRLAAHEWNPLKRIYLKDLARKIRVWELGHLKGYDAIIPIASQDTLFYTDHGFRGRIRTINSGVDLGTFNPGLPLTRNMKVGFLGSLEWLPNIQGLQWFLEHIWPKVRALNNALELHVAGKHPVDAVKEMHAEGMTFHGMVPDAAAFMAGCHFFVVPLLSGGGMRIKIVEAMAMGRCVISTTIGAEGIDCKAGEEMVLADTIEQWVAAFKRLLAHPMESLGIAEKALAAARSRFSLAAVGASLEEFYGEVLG
jgi:polysaccharide biosynthesis protein PslH